MSLKRFAFVFFAAGLASNAGIAYGADVYVPDAVPEPAPTPFTWSGVYFGVHAGGIWAKPTFRSIDCDSVTNLRGEGGVFLYEDICAADADGASGFADVDDPDSPENGNNLYFINLTGDYAAHVDSFTDYFNSGWLWGGQIGINHQIGALVLGLEADISGVSGINNKTVGIFEYFHSLNGGQLENYQGTGTVITTNALDWLVTFRARAGAAMGAEGRFLGYLTGGAAVAHVRNATTGSFLNDGGLPWCDACSFDPATAGNFYQFGYAVGVGGEYAVTSHVSLGLEYLFVGLGGQGMNSITFRGDDGRSLDFEHRTRFDNLQMVRAKLNIRY